MIQKVSLNYFKKKYEKLVRNIYPKIEAEKIIDLKLNKINRFYFLLSGLNSKFFCSQKATCLVTIKSKIAYCGYLEAKDQESYLEIINFIKTFLEKEGISNIFLPVDISLWNSHRMALTQNLKKDLLGGNYLGDIVNFDFYESALKSLKPSLASSYFSLKRNKYSYILDTVEPKCLDLKKQGFSIKNIKLNFLHLIKVYKIYKLSKDLFSSHPGFYDIGFPAFVFLKGFLEKNYAIKNNLLAIFTPEKKFIGFCNYYIEQTDIENNFFIKTIAIEKKYQNFGLTNLVIECTHKLAIKNNCQSIFYVNVKDGNKVSKMNKDNALEVGKYNLYNFN